MYTTYIYIHTNVPPNNRPPFGKKKCQGVQFLEGLTKCYLPGSNFMGEFFNTKTYKYNVTWDCPGGVQFLESPGSNFLGEFMNYIVTSNRGVQF